MRVMERLKEYRYIDDDEYARAYIQQNAVKGGQAIRYSLMHRGVSKEIIDKTLSERDENAEMEGALKAGRAYLKGRSFKDERDAQREAFSGAGAPGL